MSPSPSDPEVQNEPHVLTAVSLQHLFTANGCVHSQAPRLVAEETVDVSPAFCRGTRQQLISATACVQIQTPRLVAEELAGVMPPQRPWETWERWWKPQYPRGLYTQVSPSPKKIKPQQARQSFKVQALIQLDAIAEEGVRIINSELETMAWARNQKIWLRLDQPHNTRMHCEIVDSHGEPLLMSNQELYSVMVQLNWTLKTRALTNMQIEWQPKSVGKWHPFQWEAILHCPTAEGHKGGPSSVSRNGDCLHVWLTGRADLISLFQRTLFRQANPVTGDAVRFLYTLLSTPPCERRCA